MIKLSLIFLLLLQSSLVSAALMRGSDGRWYGNVCVTQTGVQLVPWQPVGSICYVPHLNLYGFIANS